MFSYKKAKNLSRSIITFQGVSAGKDNIVISENGSDGVIFREYAVIVNDDLTVDLYPESNGIELLDGGYGINY